MIGCVGGSVSTRVGVCDASHLAASGRLLCGRQGIGPGASGRTRLFWDYYIESRVGEPHVWYVRTNGVTAGKRKYGRRMGAASNRGAVRHICRLGNREAVLQTA